jgi:hypothetical protein
MRRGAKPMCWWLEIFDFAFRFNFLCVPNKEKMGSLSLFDVVP